MTLSGSWTADSGLPMQLRTVTVNYVIERLTPILVVVDGLYKATVYELKQAFDQSFGSIWPELKSAAVDR